MTATADRPLVSTGALAVARARTDRWALMIEAGLKTREIEMLEGMSYGLTNREIGANLYLGEDTVKTYAQHLFRKLAAHDRAHAVAIGFRNGWLA